MHSNSAPPNRPDGRRRCTPLRQLVQTAVLVLIFLLIFRSFGAEPYHVPTGSMWPALAGNHRAGNCPRCGYRVFVGRHRADRGIARDRQRFYGGAICPNCGCNHLGLEQVPECPGDHLLVNKLVFELRRPRRWEMAVFRCPAEPAKAFVKRVIGLPGENVQIHDGDVYINGALARKSLAELRAVRIPVFDNNYQPGQGGFAERWEAWPAHAGSVRLAGTSLHLDAEHSPDHYQGITYRHYSLDEKQSQPIQDEYAYNCGDPPSTVPVHDFMMEFDLELKSGSGWVQFGITDGQDGLVAEIPVNRPTDGALLSEVQTPFPGNPGRAADTTHVYARAPGFRLNAGKTYHVEMALADRRLSLAIDGSSPFPVVDLRAVDGRKPVTHPVRLGVRGVRAVVHNFRLFRDIHYTEAGCNGIKGVVSLGPAEYFVLGDNSPNSDDSRFWANRGAVAQRYFIGKPFLAHLPSRVVSWRGFGKQQERRITPDWGRIRWLR